MPNGAPQAQTLAQMIRAKYPGSYDDMNDQQLESSVLSKYPQYGDLPRTQTPAAAKAPAAPSTNQRPAYFGFTPSNMYGQAKQGLSDLWSGTKTLAGHVLNPSRPVIGQTHYDPQTGDVAVDPSSLLGDVTAGLPEQAAKAKSDWQTPGIGPKFSAAGHELASYLPFIGPWAAGLGEQAGSGDIGGAVAKGGTQAAAGYAGTKALQAAPVAAGMARDAVSNRIYTPEGKLTTGAKVASKLGAAGAGEAVGSLIGHPWAGGIAGWETGPYFLKKIFPEPDEAVQARDLAAQRKALGSFMNQGYQSALPDPNEATNADLARQEALASFMNRGYKSAYVQQPIVNPTSASDPQFSGSEGRPATWTNEDVMRLAKQGNRDAISQAIRRGLTLPENARYVMGSPDYPRAVYNPRETTTFDPEGTPIRNKSNPKALQPPAGKRLLLPWVPQ